MHEQGVLAVLVNRLLSEAGRAQVEIRLGPNMDEDVTKATFAHLVRDTHIADMRVKWRRASDLLNCLDCDADYHGTKTDLCPACGGNGLVVESAPDVALTEPEEHL